MDTAPSIPPTPPITSNNNPKLLFLGLFSIFLLGVGNGDQIKMVVDNETEFKTVSPSPESTKSLLFQDIKIGDYMEGGISISVNKGDLGKSSLILMAHRFKVDKIK